MLKLLSILFFIFLFTDSTSIYTIAVPLSVAGNVINMNDCRGKKILIVNTASNSPYAVQYGSLETLYQQYKDSLTIIAVPSNSFGNEPNPNKSIAAIINPVHHFNFLIAAESEVTGNTTGLYKWLLNKSENGIMDSEVKGDFQKYLIDSNGNLIAVFAPEVDPLDEMIQNAIKGE